MTRSDLVLLVYIVFLVPLMLVGFGYARRKMFEPQHKIVMTVITVINWALIGFVMGTTYERDVIPQLPDHLNYSAVFIPSLHLLTGGIAQLLATYLVIRMWFEKQLPEWIKVKNIKPYMRTTLVLWLITAALGLTTWAVFYHGFLISPPAANAAVAAPAANVVNLVSGQKFEPASLTVAAGTTVHFVNTDTMGHTVTADDNSFDSDELKPGQSFDHTFNQPGDVPYYCAFHGGAGGIGMSGVIHVTGTAVTSATQSPTQAATRAATAVAATAKTAIATAVVTGAATTGATQAATSSVASDANTVTIMMTNYKFDAKTITIKTGTAVIFTNQAGEDHTATADDGSFDTGLIASGKSSAPIVFNKPGTYAFYCQLHGAPKGVGMSGVITVTGPAIAGATQAVTPAVTAAPTTAALSAQSVIVALNDNVFSPATLTITAGTTVHFVNSGKHSHTVTADDGSFDSGQLKAGQTFDQTFKQPGIVQIYCENHGDKGGEGMAMLINVTAATSASVATVAATAVPATSVPATKAATIPPTPLPATTAAPATILPTIVPAATAAATTITLDPAVLAALKPLVVSGNDTPGKHSYLFGVKSQSAVIAAQEKIILSALQQGHIEDAQAAAEGILNVITNGAGTDLDQNGTINQPGDGFGLKTYIFDVNEVSSTATTTAGIPDSMRQNLADMKTTGQAALKAMDDLTTQAQALIAATSLVKAQALVPALSSATDALTQATGTLVKSGASLAVPGNELIGT